MDANEKETRNDEMKEVCVWRVVDCRQETRNHNTYAKDGLIIRWIWRAVRHGASSSLYRCVNFTSLIWAIAKDGLGLFPKHFKIVDGKFCADWFLFRQILSCILYPTHCKFWNFKFKLTTANGLICAHCKLNFRHRYVATIRKKLIDSFDWVPLHTSVHVRKEE